MYQCHVARKNIAHTFECVFLFGEVVARVVLAEISGMHYFLNKKPSKGLVRGNYHMAVVQREHVLHGVGKCSCKSCDTKLSYSLDEFCFLFGGNFLKRYEVVVQYLFYANALEEKMMIYVL